MLSIGNYSNTNIATKIIIEHRMKNDEYRVPSTLAGTSPNKIRRDPVMKHSQIIVI